MNRPVTPAMLVAAEAAYANWREQNHNSLPHNRKDMFGLVWEAMEAARQDVGLGDVARPDVMRRLRRVLQSRFGFNVADLRHYHRAVTWRDLFLADDVGLKALDLVEMQLWLEDLFDLVPGSLERRWPRTLGGLYDLLVEKVPAP